MLHTQYQQNQIRDRISVLQEELKGLETQVTTERNEQESWTPEQRIATLLHDLLCRTEYCGFTTADWTEKSEQSKENSRYEGLARALISLEHTHYPIEERLRLMIQLMYDNSRPSL